MYQRSFPVSKLIISAVIALGMFSSNTYADSNDLKYDNLRQAIKDTYGQHFNVNNLPSYITTTFKQIDFNGNGIQREEIEIYVQIVRARAIANVAKHYLVYDLNNDGLVDRDEAEKVQRSQLKMSVIATDAGGSATPKSPDETGMSKSNSVKSLKQQKDKDYFLEKTLNEIFSIDTNNNGLIEISEYRQNRRFHSKRPNEDMSKIAYALLAIRSGNEEPVTQLDAMEYVIEAFKTDAE